MNEIHCQDNLAVLASIPTSTIPLVYIDPPFGTGSVQVTHRRNQGLYTDSQFYNDKLKGDLYLLQLEERLIEIHRVLTKTGSLYIHLDWHSVYEVKPILDRIFDGGVFVNEIIWAYDYGGRPKDRWPKKHDVILWYAKSGTWTFNYDDIERIPYMAPGLVGPEKAARGKLPTDVWWMTIVPTNSKERTGYPNQKPVKLIERIIEASSKPEDVVADFYCGSGTTGVAAKNLGRKYLLVDANEYAVRIAKRRLGVT